MGDFLAPIQKILDGTPVWVRVSVAAVLLVFLGMLVWHQVALPPPDRTAATDFGLAYNDASKTPSKDAQILVNRVDNLLRLASSDDDRCLVVVFFLDNAGSIVPPPPPSMPAGYCVPPSAPMTRCSSWSTNVSIASHTTVRRIPARTT